MPEILQEQLKADWLSEPLDKAYNMGLEHALKIVKSEIVPTADVNTLVVMSSMKNSIIAKLLTLQR